MADAELHSRESLRDILRMLFRRWRLLLLGAALFAIAALLGAHHVPVKYTATARFERRMAAASQDIGRGIESFEATKLSLTEDIAGQQTVEEVMAGLKLTKDLPRDAQGQLTASGEMLKQQMMQDLMKCIRVTWGAKTPERDLISMSVTHADASLAQNMANRLVESYISRTRVDILNRLQENRAFLETQVRAATAKLTVLQNEQIEFETKHAGAMPESPGALQDRIQRATSEIEAQRRQEKAARQVLARVNSASQPAGTAATQPFQVVRGPNPELRRLEQELQAAKGQLDNARLVGHMTENHSTVITLKAKIAQVEQELRNTPAEADLQKLYGTGGVPDVLAATAAAQVQAEMAQQEIVKLEGQLAGMQALMANFAPIRQQYVRIVEDVNARKAELDRWQQKLTAIDMAWQAEDADKRTQLSSIQAAEFQYRPSSPSLQMVLGFCLVGGLAFGAGLVFLAEMLNRSIATTEEAVQHFSLPVYGVIGEIVTRRNRVLQTMRRWALYPVVTGVVLSCLALSGLSLVLWLNNPVKYQEWRLAPISFVTDAVAEKARQVVRTLKS